MYKNQIKKTITHGTFGSHTSYKFFTGRQGKFNILKKSELEKLSFDDKLQYSLELIDFSDWLLFIDNKKKSIEVMELHKKLIEQLKKEKNNN